MYLFTITEFLWPYCFQICSRLDLFVQYTDIVYDDFTTVYKSQYFSVLFHFIYFFYIFFICPPCYFTSFKKRELMRLNYCLYNSRWNIEQVSHNTTILIEATRHFFYWELVQRLIFNIKCVFNFYNKHINKKFHHWHC